MTDDELEALARWQSSHEGELFEAIRNISNGLDIMEDFMKYRSGIQQMRQYRDDLVELMERIQTVVYAATPRSEAAE